MEVFWFILGYFCGVVFLLFFDWLVERKIKRDFEDKTGQGD